MISNSKQKTRQNAKKKITITLESAPAMEAVSASKTSGSR
jgi:hypothetical protein